MRTETEAASRAGAPTDENGQPLTPVNAPRNFLCYTGDMMAFMVGLSFIPASTVLVALASKLTANQTLIGIVGSIGGIAWFLPQLFAARIVHGKRRKKPYVIAAALIGRQGYLLIAAWLVLTQAVEPVLTVWVLLLSIAVFHVCDALAGVAWFDMLSRALSPRMRGRSVALGEFAGSVLGIGVVSRFLCKSGARLISRYEFTQLSAYYRHRRRHSGRAHSGAGGLAVPL